MSAYICTPEHFQALAIFAVSRGFCHTTHKVDPRYLKYRHASLEPLEQFFGNETKLASEYAGILYAANVHSVNERYNETTDTNPEDVKVTSRMLVDPRYKVRAIDVLCMSNCLDYQSCEFEGWPESPAYALLQAIKETAIRALPGYDEAIRDFVLPTKAA